MKKFADEILELNVESTIKDIVEKMDLNDLCPTEVDHKQVNLWVTDSHKLKYDRIQKKSARKFSKKLALLIQAVIDKADSVLEEKAS